MLVTQIHNKTCMNYRVSVIFNYIYIYIYIYILLFALKQNFSVTSIRTAGFEATVRDVYGGVQVVNQ